MTDNSITRSYFTLLPPPIEHNLEWTQNIVAVDRYVHDILEEIDQTYPYYKDVVVRLTIDRKHLDIKQQQQHIPSDEVQQNYSIKPHHVFQEMSYGVHNICVSVNCNYWDVDRTVHRQLSMF